MGEIFIKVNDTDYTPLRERRLTNFTEPINLCVMHYPINEYPGETLNVEIDIPEGNCAYCLSNLNNRWDKHSCPGKSCNCSRLYKLKMTFNGKNSRLVDEDYVYVVRLILYNDTQKDMLLSSVIYRSEQVETCKGFISKFGSKTNNEKSKLSIDVKRFNKDLPPRNDDSTNFYDALFELNQKNENVLIQVCGREFNVLKGILVLRSLVFKAMLFSSEMSENENKIIKIDDSDPDVIEIMLHYIYTNKTERVHEKPLEVLKVAYKYGIQDLQDVCIEWMKSNVNLKNFLAISKLAMAYDLIDLQDCISQYVEKEEEILITRRDFQNYLSNKINSSSVAEVLRFCRKHPSKLDSVKKMALQFLEKNIESVMEMNGFLNLFGGSFTQELVLFLFKYKKNCAEKEETQRLFI
ncbi:hypothetical protein QAD02_005299 [Eretmocerus hayati]|uniref:Uncharacterized protein n=1 Tax=Eretmocerus hayati TaxID=131215 RepID=A0ACC2NUY3_9HYME|nr:hypothetical protein QAD02_005299 [Eretmocerus hayati]